MEIRVKKLNFESFSGNEVWQEIKKGNNGKCFERVPCGDRSEWYTVSDPFGYCERNYMVSDDTVFIICDEKGNELFRHSNKSNLPFLSFEQTVRRAWEALGIHCQEEDYQKDFMSEYLCGETTQKLNMWLLSFMDTELYPDEIRGMHFYPENWCSCLRYSEQSVEPIKDSTFSYLGKTYQFCKVKYRHTVCGAEWYAFVCTDAPYTRYDNNWNKDVLVDYMTMGNVFDSTKTGAMYATRQAKEIIISGLKKIYPSSEKYPCLYAASPKTGFYKSVSYESAAEKLLRENGKINLRRAFVDSVIEKEQKNPAYFSTRDAVLRQYPNLYWCGA